MQLRAPLSQSLLHPFVSLAPPTLNTARSPSTKDSVESRRDDALRPTGTQGHLRRWSRTLRGGSLFEGVTSAARGARPLGGHRRVDAKMIEGVYIQTRKGTQTLKMPTAGIDEISQKNGSLVANLLFHKSIPLA